MPACPLKTLNLMATFSSKVTTLAFGAAALAWSAAVLPAMSQTQQAPSFVKPAEPAIEGLPVTLGDTLAKVQATYNTTLEAEPYKSSVNSNGTALRLKSKGVWLFFNSDGRIVTIRLDAPFAQGIGGIKIGSTVEQMKQVRGEPVKQFEMAGDQAYLYPLNDVVSVRYNVNANQRVETIFLVK
jgi:hypothetical protein